MFRRLVPLLALAILAAAPAGSALATCRPAPPTSRTLRYRPALHGQLRRPDDRSPSSSSRRRTARAIGFTTGGVGTSDLTVDVNGTLASNVQYRLKLTVDDGLGGGDALDADVPHAQGARPSGPPRQVHHRHPRRRRARHGPPDRQGQHRGRADERRLHRRLDPEPLGRRLHRRAQAPPVGARGHRPAGAEHSRAREARSTGTATPSTASSSPARRTGSRAAPAGTRRARSDTQGGPWEKHWSLYYYEDITAERATRRRRPRARAPCRATS